MTRNLFDKGQETDMVVTEELRAEAKKRLFEYAKTFPFFNLLGIEAVDIKPGWSKLQVTYRHDLCQPAGVMHGGVIASLVDTGIAHSILLTDTYLELQARGGGIVSLDLRIKYLRPVSDGVVTCESNVFRIGKRIIHADSIVTNAEGKEIARGDAIYSPVEVQQLRKQG